MRSEKLFKKLHNSEETHQGRNMSCAARKALIWNCSCEHDLASSALFLTGETHDAHLRTHNLLVPVLHHSLPF